MVSSEKWFNGNNRYMTPIKQWNFPGPNMCSAFNGNDWLSLNGHSWEDSKWAFYADA